MRCPHCGKRVITPDEKARQLEEGLHGIKEEEEEDD